MRPTFADRRQAGRRLGTALLAQGIDADVVVGLPRGGVPVAAEVALILGAPLDVIVVRKLGVPGHRELAMGAIGEDGARVVDTDLVHRLGVTEDDLALVESAERDELASRRASIRARHPRLDLSGRSVVVVDDGVATGSTARAACTVARAHGASHVTLAVPVAPRRWESEMGDTADRYLALETPDDFQAVGLHYDDFSSTSDREVDECLAAPAGQLLVPRSANGIVVFAHGSGSDSRSPRNRHVAAELRRRGVATFLIDLLAPSDVDDEPSIEVLARRLSAAVAWLGARPDTAALPVSLCGASTGGAVALWASTDPDVHIAAIVLRSGRPDLASERLGRVEAPTLLIVGGADRATAALNQRAAASLRCQHRLVVVPEASHLFGEPGTLDQAARLTAAWIERYGLGR